MSRDYTAVPHEYLEEMDILSDAEFGRLIRALLEYSMTGEEKELSGGEKAHWKRVRNRENRYQEGFENNEKVKTERARSAAKARWNNAQACASNANDANACTSIPSNAKNAYTNTNSNTNSNTKAKEESNAREDFEKFWSAYPRKAGNKQKAFEAFKKAGVSLDILLTAVENQKQSAQWSKDGGQFIPHPTTWLNGKRWEDQMISDNSGRKLERQLDADEIESIRRMMASPVDMPFYGG